MNTFNAGKLLSIHLTHAQQGGRILSLFSAALDRSNCLARAAMAALPLVLTAASPPQQPKPKCSIEYRAAPRLTDLLQLRGFQFDGYAQFCPILAARGLGLDITSQSGVLAERSYGFVFVALFRTRTSVVGYNGRSSMNVSRDASTPESDEMLFEALSSVLTAIAQSPGVYMDAVDAEEAKLRRTLAASS